MKEKLEKKLFKDFPCLYGDKDKSPRETLICFGMETGDGWHDLIRRLSIKLEPICKKHGCRASQVKEKFGTLRFYLTFNPEETDEPIREAEKESAITCEICGKAGKLRGSSWMSTECDECWENTKRKRDEV